MGTWGVTFPLGSLALLTFSLGNSFDSLFFKWVHIPTITHEKQLTVYPGSLPQA